MINGGKKGILYIFVPILNSISWQKAEKYY
jgi:hypothetical protein